MRKLFLIVLFTLLHSVQAQSFSVSHIPEELTEDAYLVVRKEQMEVDFVSVNKVIIRLDLALTILKGSGSDYAVIPMPYNKNTTIKKYDGSLYDASGKLIRKFRKKDLNDESVFDGFSLFTDRRIQYYRVNVASYPYTVHYQIEIESSNTMGLPDWAPLTVYNAGVESSEFIFTNRTGTEIRMKEIGFEGWDVEKSESGQQVKYSMKNVPPLERETMSPQLKELTPRVYFAPTEFQMEGIKGKFENWEQFGSWYYKNLLEDKNDLSPKDRETALNLVEGVSDPVEKIKILYQYMQSKTRYINVAIGIGGWEPFPASYVSSKSYGDCKALSNYMISLLDVADIKGYHTVVYGETGRAKDMDKDFASIEGNHMIVNVPLEDETIWLECTDQQSAFNFLGRFTDNRYAVSVTPEGGKVVKTQSFQPEENLELVTLKGEIALNGKLTADLSIEDRGQQYENLNRLYFADSKEQRESLIKELSSFPNLNIVEYNFENDKDSAVFKSEIKLESTQYAKAVGNDLLLNLIPYGRSESWVKKDKTRKFPFEIRFGYVDRAEVELKLPAGYKVSEKLAPVIYTSEFGDYILTLSEPEPGLIKVNRKLTINDGVFPKEKYNDYVDFRRKISSLDNYKILLERN